MHYLMSVYQGDAEAPVTTAGVAATTSSAPVVPPSSTSGVASEDKETPVRANAVSTCTAKKVSFLYYVSVVVTSSAIIS